MDLTFEPCAARARRMDEHMRGELADSLEHVVKEVGLQWPGSDTAAYLRDLIPAIELLRGSERVDPALFAAYYRLVLALLEEEPAVRPLVTDLLEVARPSPQLTFSDLSDAGLGSERRRQLYLEALDSDAHARFSFLPPTPAQSQATRQAVLDGLALMRRTAPELAGEVEALVSHVVLAAGPQEPGAPRFDGASSYQLWGALALSVDDLKTPLEMMETLAHEAGHSFLFGLTIEEPLVENGDDELFRSPLRPDPRPMDGIFHATFVSARMHYAMLTAQRSGLLDPQQHAECGAYLQASRKAFDDGLSVVLEHACLSATGRGVLQSAREFMAQCEQSAGAID